MFIAQVYAELAEQLVEQLDRRYREVARERWVSTLNFKRKDKKDGPRFYCLIHFYVIQDGDRELGSRPSHNQIEAYILSTSHAGQACRSLWKSWITAFTFFLYRFQSSLASSLQNKRRSHTELGDRVNSLLTTIRF